MKKELSVNDYMGFVSQSCRIMDVAKLGTDKKYANMCIAAMEAENEVLRLRSIIRNGGIEGDYSPKSINHIIEKKECIRISMTPKK